MSETVQDELRIGAKAPAAGRRRHYEHRVYTPRGRFELRLGHTWRYRRTISHFGWTYIQTRFQGMWLGWLWLLVQLIKGQDVPLPGRLVPEPRPDIPERLEPSIQHQKALCYAYM